MKQRIAQQGSAHVVIIVILIIALIGALGWIFWQNFNNKDGEKSDLSKEASAQTAKDNESTIKTTEGSIDPNFGTTLTFKYPESWKYNASISGEKSTGMWGQTIDIASPSGKYTVTYNLNQGGGFGGTCFEEDAGKIAKLQYEELKEFKGTSYTEYTLSDSGYADGVPASYAGLAVTAAVKDANAGSSMCKVAMAAINTLDADRTLYLMGASVSVNGAKASEEFEAALSGKEYEQAKAILLSTTH